VCESIDASRQSPNEMPRSRAVSTVSECIGTVLICRIASSSGTALMSGGSTPTASYDFDGYRIEYADWWFNIRPSNTEPYLRLLAEAKTQEMLAEKLKIMKAIIGQYE
jgi:phosphomannomutase